MSSPRGKTWLFLLIGLQALVSAASLVVEIVAGRVLAPYVGMSIYTWTSVIAVVLLAISVVFTFFYIRLLPKENET